MRFTADKVRAISTALNSATNGLHGLAYTRSDVDGTVFVDVRRWKVWRGNNAARKAAAYYFGQMNAKGIDRPADIEPLYKELFENDRRGFLYGEFIEGKSNV